MAARTPRRSFAAPFVVTLAAAPACYVQTAPGPSGPPPSPPPTQTEPAQPTSQPPPPVMSNPPPPVAQTPPATDPRPPTDSRPPRPTRPPGPPQTTPTTPTPPTTPTTPTQMQDAKWTVYKANDGSGCMAAIKVECVPKATCNPPPPFKYACPENVSLDKPVTVVTHNGTDCFVEFEMPKCPPGVACNPPRPRPVACPKR